MRLDDALSQVTALKPVTGGQGAGSAAPDSFSADFKQALSDAQSVHTVQSGEKLVGIVRQEAQAQGVALSDSQTLRWAQALASQNKMPNANRIYPGQQLNLSAMHAQWKADGPEAPLAQANANAKDELSTPNQAPVPSTAAILSSKAALQRTPVSVYAKTAAQNGTLSRASNATIPRTTSAGAAMLNTANPVLDKTLDRAVDKGFIPANEKQAVYQKVLQMASKHGFAPDDFARMTLMESDGMNPKASNQRCHGIIQFCDGPARGAAAVGMASNPKSILGLSVYQQLHLADTYFQKAGLNKQKGAVPLDDLYLAVLQPAARSETRTDAPLGIMGTQASALYGDKNTTPTITRQSIVRGLMQNAQRVLGLDRAQKQPDNRAQAQRVASNEVSDAAKTLPR